MTTKQASKRVMYARIKSHGERLLRIFPDAPQRDPVKLCKQLRILEGKAVYLALRMQNDSNLTEDAADILLEALYAKVCKALFGNGPKSVRVFIDLYQLGFALKIDAAYMRAHGIDLNRDDVGNGIIAPVLSL